MVNIEHFFALILPHKVPYIYIYIYLGEYPTLYCPFKTHCIIMLHNRHHHQRCFNLLQELYGGLEVLAGLRFGISMPINKSFMAKPCIEIILKYSDMLHNVAQLLHSAF